MFCLLVSARVGCVSWIERDLFLSFQSRWSSFGDQEINPFKFYKVEDPK
jgi:hypothetical protein